MKGLFFSVQGGWAGGDLSFSNMLWSLLDCVIKKSSLTVSDLEDKQSQAQRTYA